MLVFALAASVLGAEETGSLSIASTRFPGSSAPRPCARPGRPTGGSSRFSGMSPAMTSGTCTRSTSSAPTPSRITSLSPTSPPREGGPGSRRGRVASRRGENPVPPRLRALPGLLGRREAREGGRRIGGAVLAGRAPTSLTSVEGDLFVRDTNATERALVSDPRAEVFVESFEWSLDGRSIAFVRGGRKPRPSSAAFPTISRSRKWSWCRFAAPIPARSRRP